MFFTTSRKKVLRCVSIVFKRLVHVRVLLPGSATAKLNHFLPLGKQSSDADSESLIKLSAVVEKHFYNPSNRAIRCVYPTENGVLSVYNNKGQVFSPFVVRQSSDTDPNYPVYCRDLYVTSLQLVYVIFEPFVCGGFPASQLDAKSFGNQSWHCWNWLYEARLPLTYWAGRQARCLLRNIRRWVASCCPDGIEAVMRKRLENYMAEVTQWCASCLLQLNDKPEWKWLGFEPILTEVHSG